MEEFDNINYDPCMFVPYCYGCPYFPQFNEGEMNYPKWQRGIEEDDESDAVLEFENEDLNEDEELEYFDEDSRSAQDVNRVMGLINARYESFYRRLMSAGMSRALARYLFRSIVTFVDINYNKYKGTIENKTTAAFNDLRRQQPWIFFVMRSYGIPQTAINQIVTTIIRFSFNNLRK